RWSLTLRCPSSLLLSFAFSSRNWPPPSSTLFPYTTLFRSQDHTTRSQRIRLIRSIPPESSPHGGVPSPWFRNPSVGTGFRRDARSEEHTSELQSLTNLVCRLLLEKKKNNDISAPLHPPHPP